jgi:hypothetical protein
MNDQTALRADRNAKTLRELALEKMREAILELRFRPGNRLVERTLCDQLGVSRTVSGLFAYDFMETIVFEYHRKHVSRLARCSKACLPAGPQAASVWHSERLNGRWPHKSSALQGRSA